MIEYGKRKRRTNQQDIKLLLMMKLKTLAVGLLVSVVLYVVINQTVAINSED